jgi:hypothetical protein
MDGDINTSKCSVRWVRTEKYGKHSDRRNQMNDRWAYVYRIKPRTNYVTLRPSTSYFQYTFRAI